MIAILTLLPILDIKLDEATKFVKIKILPITPVIRYTSDHLFQHTYVADINLGMHTQTVDTKNINNVNVTVLQLCHFVICPLCM